MKKASEMPGGSLSLASPFFFKNKRERENKINGIYLSSVLIPNV